MKRTYWIAAAIIVVLAAGAYWYWSSRGAGNVSVDLVEAFRGAEKRSTVDTTAAFAMTPQTVAGVTRPSIFMHPTSRVIFHDVAIPEGGHFRAWLAIKEEAWDKGTDGVVFRVGVSLGSVYEELLNRQVAPYVNPKDRGWVPVDLDLAKWGGKQVNIILNTEASLPGYAPNNMYDFAVFGEPAVVVVRRQ